MDQSFKKLNEIAKKVQAPLQEIAELNVKTLQGFNYLPKELANIQKPEDLWVKPINLAVENGHKTLDYMQKAFEIVEKAMLSIAQEVKDTAAH